MAYFGIEAIKENCFWCPQATPEFIAELNKNHGKVDWTATWDNIKGMIKAYPQDVKY
jgi:hypothetical protein